MRPRNNKYVGALFLHHVCLLCFIWEHDQENNEGRVGIRDNNNEEEEGVVVDENQGCLLPRFFSCLLSLLDLQACVADATLTGADGVLLKRGGEKNEADGM